MREKKKRAEEMGFNIRDQLYSKMIKEEVAHDLVSKPMMEILKNKFV